MNENTRKIVPFISRHINAMTCFFPVALLLLVLFSVSYFILCSGSFYYIHLMLAAVSPHFNNIHKFLEEVNNLNYNELVWLVRKLKFV